MANFSAAGRSDFFHEQVPSTPEIRAHYPEYATRLDRRKGEITKQNELARLHLNEQIKAAPGDSVDETVLETSADYFLKRNNTLQAELSEIRNALDRIQRGVYGMCEHCENPIAGERLENLPYARLCIDCQTLLERKRVRPLSKS
jgi:RNA polymerase-binding protein DksA